MLLASAAHVLGDTGVKRVVGTPEQIDEPSVAVGFGLGLSILGRV